MKKICMIAVQHGADDPRVYHKEAKSLANNGYKVSIICRETEVNKPSSFNPKFFLVKGNIVKKSYDALKKALSLDADVYPLHDPQSFYLGLFLKIFYKKKIIFDVHEFYRFYVKQKSQNIKGKIYNFLAFYLLFPLFWRIVDGFVVVTDEMKKEYIRHKKSTEVIYNFPLDMTIEKEKLHKTRRKILVYEGGISKERGVFLYLKAIKKLKRPGYTLLLIGPFAPEELEEEVRAYIERIDLSAEVTIMGRILHERMYVLLKESKIGLCLLSSLNNSRAIPVKLFEYLRMGIPVICSNNITFSNEVLREYKCGVLVEYGNVEAIVEAVKEIEKGYRTYQKNAVKASRAFTWETEEKKLLEFYKKVLN